MIRNEKPGGHGERSLAVGVLDTALWDATAKIAGVPLHRLLAARHRGGAVDAKVFVYAAPHKLSPEQIHGKNSRVALLLLSRPFHSRNSLTVIWAGPAVGWAYLVCVIDCRTR
jgi:hypothetical protein